MSEAIYRSLLWIKSDNKGLIAASVGLLDERRELRREGYAEGWPCLGGEVDPKSFYLDRTLNAIDV